jgi:hypothetical protein
MFDTDCALGCASSFFSSAIIASIISSTDAGNIGVDVVEDDEIGTIAIGFFSSKFKFLWSILSVSTTGT